MTNFFVDDKPAVKIFAKKLKELDKAILFDCEGDQVWLPKSCFRMIDKETILIQEWMYNQKFDN